MCRITLIVADESHIEEEAVQYAVMHIDSMAALSRSRSELILVEGKYGNRTVLACGTPVKFHPSDRIGIYEIARKNLKVEIGDRVTVCCPSPDDEYSEAEYICVLPLENYYESFGVNLEEGVKQYFEEAANKLLPFHEGNTFSIENDMHFKVLKIKPSPFSTITDTTRVELGEGFWDLGGCQQQIDQIRNAVEVPLCSPRISVPVRKRPPCGVLLVGRPGTGRRCFARAVSNQLGASFYEIDVLDLSSNEGVIGQAEEEAKTKGGLVFIFIDDIDSVGSKRSSEVAKGFETRILRRLLKLMDRLKDCSNIIFFAATSQLECLDPVLRRSGRFEQEVKFETPDADGRLAILRIHTREMNLDDDVDLQIIANETEEWVGADIAKLCHEAAQAHSAHPAGVDTSTDTICVNMDAFRTALSACHGPSPTEDAGEKLAVNSIRLNAEKIEGSQIYLSINHHTPHGVGNASQPAASPTYLSRTPDQRSNGGILNPTERSRLGYEKAREAQQTQGSAGLLHLADYPYVYPASTPAGEVSQPEETRPAQAAPISHEAIPTERHPASVDADKGKQEAENEEVLAQGRVGYYEGEKNDTRETQKGAQAKPKKESLTDHPTGGSIQVENERGGKSSVHSLRGSRPPSRTMGIVSPTPAKKPPPITPLSGRTKAAIPPASRKRAPRQPKEHANTNTSTNSVARAGLIGGVGTDRQKRPSNPVGGSNEMARTKGAGKKAAPREVDVGEVKRSKKELPKSVVQLRS